MLVTNGYSINDVDKCIYSKYEDNTCVVICLYVDDMLIFGTKPRGCVWDQEIPRF